MQPKADESHLAGGTQDATGTAASITVLGGDSTPTGSFLVLQLLPRIEPPKSLQGPFPSLILPYVYCAGGETEAQHKGSRSPGLVPI